MSIIYAYMRNFLSGFFKSTKGFTLIELLVVMGILGILATALVATIDPFEQLKKANDTNTMNTLVEFINGTTRYYTTHSAYPWDTVAKGGAACNAGAAPSSSVLTYAAPMKDCLDALINDNELKSAFSSSTVLKNIYITYDATTTQTAGCFAPTALSILHNSNTHWTKAGADDTTHCDTIAHKDLPGSAGICFWCTR